MSSNKQVDEPKPVNALVLSTIASSLAGFLFGYDNIVISGAIGHLAKAFRLEPVEIGWAAGCALIGCLLGSALSGWFADKFGLKRALYACAGCFALSSLGVYIAGTFTQYVVWRILGGVGIGAASIVAPMYIAEIAPAKIRGRLVVFYQLGIVVGILSAVYVNLLIERSGSETWNVQHGWRWMFAVGALPATIFCVLILFCKESPRWLMKTGQSRRALSVMSSISGPAAAYSELDSIRMALSEEQGGVKELLAGPFRRALVIGFFLAAFTQASGITCLLSFLPEVLRSAGQVGDDPFFQSVLVGVVNLIFTMLAIWLVDKSGRKTLLLFGTAMQTIALAVVGLLYFTQHPGQGLLLGIMTFVAGHAVGNGAVCWVIISEIFPTKVRGISMSIATTALWASAYLANQFFPLMQRGLGDYGAFFFFAAMAMLNFFFVLSLVPETRGFSLEEISRIWSPQLRHVNGKSSYP